MLNPCTLNHSSVLVYIVQCSVVNRYTLPSKLIVLTLPVYKLHPIQDLLFVYASLIAAMSPFVPPTRTLIRAPSLVPGPC